MIVGVGIDLVELQGFRAQLEDRASSFAARTFTLLELSEANSRPGGDPVPHLAARFAAKEAFIKAWSTANRGNPRALAQVDMREIEVVSDVRQRPSMRVHGAVAMALEALELAALHVSLSHDGPFATGLVVLER